MSVAQNDQQAPSAEAGTSRRLPTSNQLIMQVARREISTKLRDRSYIMSVLVFILIIAAVVGFNILANKNSNNYTVAIVGENAEFEAAAQAQAKQADAKVTFTKVADRAAGEKAVQDDADALIDGDTIVRKDTLPGQLNVILQGAHQSVSVVEKAKAEGISPDQLAKVMQVEPMKEQSLAASSGHEMERGLIAMLGVGFAYGMMMMIIQFVAQGVVEEKSSRVVELLLTALRPRQLLAGKVLGLGVLGFAQLLLVIGLGAAAAILGGLLAIPAGGWATIFQVLAWFVLGYAFFATLAAAAASLVSRQEDLGSALMPLTFVPMIAFFLSFTVLNSPDGPLAMILSLVPGISPTTMPVRAALTAVPIWQYVVAVVLQIAAIYFLVRLAGRIYSGAMLKTSGKLKAREALARDRAEASV